MERSAQWATKSSRFVCDHLTTNQNRNYTERATWGHVARSFFFGATLDVATKNLDHILNSDEYVLFEKGIPLFDEHDEFDKSGKLVRHFGPDELRTIARNCNNRAKTTGDLTVWAPGHSKDDVETEEDQPPIRGFYHNYRVGKYGPGGKLAVVADCYVKRVVTTTKGQKVDGREYARSLPRRSVELWPNSMTIDWVAHLRRSPMRDLGLATYSRDSYELLYSPGRVAIAARMNDSKKLRYQMEIKMDDERDVTPPADDTTPVDLDPTTAPSDEMEPEGHEDFVRHLDHSLKNHPVMKYMHGMCKKYAAGMASPTNQALPQNDMEDDDEKADYENGVTADQPINPKAGNDDMEAIKNMRHKRTGVQVSRYQRQLDEVTAKLANSEKRERLARYERDLNEMAFNEGIEIDVADELLDCAAMDDKAFDARKEKIRKNYQRSPVGARIPEGFIPKDTTVDPLTKHADEIIRYARQHNLSEKHGADAFFEAARRLKYIPSDK